MSCKTCSSHPVWKFTNQRQLCTNCFVDYFERKILATIRKQGGLTNNIQIEKKDIRSKIIQNIISPIHVENSQKKKLIVKNLNDLSLDIMSNLIYKQKPKSKNEKNNLAPLIELSDDEIKIYCTIKKLKFNIKRKLSKKQKDLDEFIAGFEKTNPDVRHGIANSI